MLIIDFTYDEKFYENINLAEYNVFGNPQTTNICQNITQSNLSTIIQL